MVDYKIMPKRLQLSCGALQFSILWLISRAGLTMLKMFQLKRAGPQSVNFRGLLWYWYLCFWL